MKLSNIFYGGALLVYILNSPECTFMVIFSTDKLFESYKVVHFTGSKLHIISILNSASLADSYNGSCTAKICNWNALNFI